MRTLVGDAVVDVPSDAIGLLSSTDGPALPPMKLMSVGACDPLERIWKFLSVSFRKVTSPAEASTHSVPVCVRPWSSTCLAATCRTPESVTAAPAAGLKTTSVDEVFVESAPSVVSGYVPAAIRTVWPGVAALYPRVSVLHGAACEQAFVSLPDGER